MLSHVPSFSSIEKEPHSMASQDAAMNDQQSDMTSDSSLAVQPVVGASWRGRFSIPCLNLDVSVAAHVSNKACLKVTEVASTMPNSLCLEMIPRCETWPASFTTSPPTEHSIALFFFSKGRDEEVLDKLMNHAICTDVALKSMIGEAELLIFTSLQLPRNLQKLQGKPYFWGVFRGQPGAASHQSDYHVQTIRVRKSLSPNSGYPKSFNFEGIPVTFSSTSSPITQASKGDRRGRRLDDAWQHAKPLDVLRQKAECIYCGFVSSHGGISRLKAHLGGGNPGTRLSGCPKVSPEVKKVMAEWFSEWVKNTKAPWTKEIRESAGYVDKRGPHDAAQEHAKPLDAQQTYCEYFGSKSIIPGGIHHKVQLGGGSKMHQENGHRASAEIKGVMSDWVKKTTATKMKKSQAGGSTSAGERPERRGRPLDDAWGHAKPLDDARQKTSCNYCGFISSYGGISRLKAHLGGGCPQMQLQGCPQVPPEVKRVMEQWFSEWSKYSSAAWTRNSNAPGKLLKRARPDDAWEHAIPLDETGEATRCKYCGFVSKCGGIARMKAHLSGGDPTMQLECCPNVPPEIRNSMSGVKKKHKKKSKGLPLETFEGSERTSSEAQLSNKQCFVLQETLDEISNSSVKGRLKRLIEEKNGNVQKMQFEVTSLQRHLASMP